MLIVVKSHINPWQYPPRFDFHYGDWMRKDFESGNSTPWSTTIMPSLALLITQVLLASKTVFGPKPEKLLASVPYENFITATVKEINTLKSEIETDTRNVLLTLARVWLTVETDMIGSKQKAAQWAIQKLPDTYKPVMRKAHDATMGTQNDEWEDVKSLLLPCADFMIGQIHNRVSLIEATDTSSKSIKLAT